MGSQVTNNVGSEPTGAARLLATLSPCHLVTLSFLPLSLLLAGCGKPNPADRPLRPEQVTDFAVLYGQHCAGCHGADGKLGPAPPLNDPLFLAIVPDDVVQGTIAGGRSGTPMPAFAPDRGGPLTDAQVTILAQGIKKRWPAAKDQSAIPPYLAPAQPGDVTRGGLIFGRACGACHGFVGQGGKHGDQDVGAVNDHAFLALISDQALRRLIITGRPDLGMPSIAGAEGRPQGWKPLTSQEAADLVALLAYWRQGGK